MLERGEVGNSWRTERWDSLRLLTPNWQTRLPGMGYCGAPDLAELRSRAHFVRISSASLQEGHVHDVIITKEAPNYRVE